MNYSSDHEPRSGDRHGWNSIEGYFNAHERHVERFADYFLVNDALQFWPVDSDQIKGEGRLTFRDGLFIDVHKVLIRNNRGQVRTASYSYHAGIEGPSDRTIFRYDNAHEYARERHPDAHHKHRYNHATWEEIEPPEWIGYDRWPTLAEVIEELYVWWEEHGQGLAEQE